MDTATLNKLEFDRIREMIAGYCASALGKRLAESMTPATNPKLVAQWHQQVRELIAACDEHGLPPMGGVYDIREFVRATGFPTPLEPDALARVADTLAATSSLTTWLDGVLPVAPSLSKLAQRVDDFSPIAAAIGEAIDARGQVKSEASAKLANIRGSIETARGSLRTVIDRIVRRPEYVRMLQYGGGTFHNDRMVLPLKSEYQGRIPGIVHRSSDSGATLFVEPSESVELNNAIARLRDAESKEITRILRGLCQRIHLNAPAILNTLGAVAVLDLIGAKVRYAKRRQCVCPVIDDGGVLDLHGARHPLLIELFEGEAESGREPRSLTVAALKRSDPPPEVAALKEDNPSSVSAAPEVAALKQGEASRGLKPADREACDARPQPAAARLHDVPRRTESAAQDASAKSAPRKRDVVPNDIRLGDDFDVMVMTGPNTGGKTVALKTVGLFALMTQCGVPIPAGEGSRMPVFGSVFIDIGDEQSIQQSLSTFSSHLSNQLDILRKSGPKSLVLIDELGAGTDPDEGAAIGRAVLAELLHVGAKAIVTTHLSALKAVAYTTTRVDNACVEFDPESLRPTFQLRIGEPGNSNALIIAKRLGMPARLVQKAKEYLSDTNRALDSAIAGTLESRRQAEAARRDARAAALDAQRARDQLEQDREALRKEQEAFAEWTKWVKALSPDDAVHIRSLKRSAVVVRMQLHKQTALVTAGAMDIEVPLRDIERPRERS